MSTAVYTNRTPATAMRGFGVTALDFALECQMDKGATAISMDPLEYRILNAYRDGDMKAHRREAKNCALIECAQVAAEKANMAVRDESTGCRRARPAPPPGPVALRTAPAHRHQHRPHQPARRQACPQMLQQTRRSAFHTNGRPPRRRVQRRLRRREAHRHPAGFACRIDARSAALFFRLWQQEALIMARHRGRGVATINYPIGINLGGDPSQALVHSNPTGKFTVALSSIDLGQGMKSVTRQICAETLGVPVEDVYVDTANSDTGPALHGIVRVARNAPRRQRRDGGGARSPRRHDGGRGRRA